MILIIASELNTVAQDAAAEWPGGPAIVLTPRDLCTRGWRIDLGAFDESQIVPGGSIYPVRDVMGVVTLLPYVMDYELFAIEEPERKYAASEITAFLFYFLSRLECPVLNRPTAHCLTGPSWRPEQWNVACRRAGIHAKPLRRQQALQPTTGKVVNVSTCISVVGSKCVGETRAAFRSSAMELARLARVDFLTVRLAGEDEEQTLHSVELVPDLRDGLILEAVQNHFVS